MHRIMLMSHSNIDFVPVLSISLQFVILWEGSVGQVAAASLQHSRPSAHEDAGLNLFWSHIPNPPHFSVSISCISCHSSMSYLNKGKKPQIYTQKKKKIYVLLSLSHCYSATSIHLHSTLWHIGYGSLEVGLPCDWYVRQAWAAATAGPSADP